LPAIEKETQHVVQRIRHEIYFIFFVISLLAFQAALGSSALDLALKLDRPDQEVYWATQVRAKGCARMGVVPAKYLQGPGLM